jgi:hypothetical protein
VCVLMSLRSPESRLDSLVNMVGLSWLNVQRCSHMRGPPMGGSTPAKGMFGSICPSTTLRQSCLLRRCV